MRSAAYEPKARAGRRDVLGRHGDMHRCTRDPGRRPTGGAGPRYGRDLLRETGPRSLPLYGRPQEPRGPRVDQGAGRLHDRITRAYSRARRAALTARGTRRGQALSRDGGAPHAGWACLPPEAGLGRERIEALHPSVTCRTRAAARRPRSHPRARRRALVARLLRDLARRQDPSLRSGGLGLGAGRAPPDGCRHA